jgi:hypothetical protein
MGFQIMGTGHLKTVSLYPKLIRQQGHGYHDYLLRLSDSVYVNLSEEQVRDLWRQIVKDQSGLSQDDVDKLRAELKELHRKIK